ncbi:DUF3303 domain-containing protein [Mycobacterium sp. 21AC1]|uniref:DUF3303 domain-containing protein n=1 Tax=[Mycobacterium] appelbergii TaxID=2939269 RepID=UPI00293927A2|nr:DUF3303 family protein [Mycobacterium sp. 21AC1]MDV3125700.1 DUF3303 domain-containing protein [Mycobacterium sp. 21AC1]
MKFIVHWTQSQTNYRDAIDRFKKNGAQMPDGVTMLGRWWGMNGQGFAVVETDNAKAMFESVAEWGEFLTMDVTPAVEDTEAGEVLAKLF